MSRRTAVIVAWHFPPGPGVGGRRPHQLMQQLPPLGWDVRVVTARLPEGPRGDPNIIETARGKLGEWVRATLPASDQPLFEQWSGAPSQGGGGAESVKARAMRAARGLLVLPDEHAPWSVLGRAAARQLSRVDVVVSTSPPFSAHLLGRWLARRFDAPHVVDYRDPFSRNAGWPPGRLDRPLREALDRRALLGADAVVTVSEGFAALLSELGAPHVDVVRNAWDAADRQEPAPVDPSGPVLLVHTGTLYAEYAPLAGILREALQGREVRLVHCGRGGDVLGIGEDRGLVPRGEAAGLRASASALLLFVAGGDAGRGWIPAKLYDYIAAGRPVLVVGEPDEEKQRLLRDAGLGEAVGTVEGIARRLDGLAEAQRTGRLDRLAASPKAVEGHGPRVLGERYAAILHRITGAPSGGAEGETPVGTPSGSGS